MAATKGNELVYRESDDNVPSLDNVKSEAVEENIVDSETSFDFRFVVLGRAGGIV
jgi:hypothetical protein